MTGGINLFSSKQNIISLGHSNENYNYYILFIIGCQLSKYYLIT